MPPPWQFTTWLELLDHWQTLAAGLLAVLAAVLGTVVAVLASPWPDAADQGTSARDTEAGSGSTGGA